MSNELLHSRVEGQTAIAIGVFDGLHLGHQHLLQRLCAEAAALHCTPMVVSFQRHPSCVLGRREEELWLTEEWERESLLHSMGIEVCVLPFTPELYTLSACQFVEQYLVGRLHMRMLLLGYDSRFGSRQNDDFDRLPLLSEHLGFTLLRDEPYLHDGCVVSSTLIRQSLAQGDVAMASRLLGKDYCVYGTVEHGRADGRRIGFPTANVSLAHCRKMMPLQGVYAVRLQCDGREWKGMANWGSQPTFEGDSAILEVHLFQFEGSLYGREVSVSFTRRLRDIRKFPTLDELIAQLNIDKEVAQ